jgi:hypothetical protein
MKIATLTESPADDAAVRLLVDGLYGQPTDRPALPASLEARGGWTVVLSILEPILKSLHYQTDAEALVVVLDSDEGPIHNQEHEQPGKADGDCRLCAVQHLIARTRAKLRPTGRPPLKTAVGLAVPAVEAWYLCGIDHAVGEAQWLVGMNSGKPSYTKKSLKTKVYGSDRVSLERATECAVREVTRLAQDFKNLEAFFPGGFGPLAREVRSWATAVTT